MVEKIFLVMRGWPGSGKSTLVKRIVEHMCSGVVGEDAHDLQRLTIASADHFHINPITKLYEWRPERVKIAHEMCFQRFRLAVKDRHTLIILDNTNIKRVDYGRYLNGAYTYGYKCYQAIPQTEWMNSVDECFKRNEHSVPLETIKRMMDGFEQDPTLGHFKLPGYSADCSGNTEESRTGISG